jgi:hypothetical protein
MVSRALIRQQVADWNGMPEDERGSLEDYLRSYLEKEIPPSERQIQRGNETVDAIDHIIEDLDSYVG